MLLSGHLFYGLATLRLLLPLLLLAVGCGQPEEPSVEDGLALATETYRQHLANGIPADVFGATVIKRGDYFIELLGASEHVAYRVPMPSGTDRRTATERASEARTGADWQAVPDSAVVARLAVVVGTFERANLDALFSDPDSSFATFRVTPYDRLSYYRSGVDPDTIQGNALHWESITREWVYSRGKNSHDGT